MKLTFKRDKKLKILITGASGFVGRRLCELAQDAEYDVVKQFRDVKPSSSLGSVTVKEINGHTDWSHALNNVNCVVHCAARVHQMSENGADVLSLYRETNVAGTLNLAKQAAAHGVERFIFLSSIKVNGELTLDGEAFQPQVTAEPKDPYGLSKYEAEQGLLALGEKTGLDIVIIRPPLVYGPEVKANFLSLLKWVKRGVPLPLGSINNLRSMVYVDNLVDLILTCCKHHAAVGHTFLVSDDYDVSTSVLLKQIAHAMGKSDKMLPLPEGVLMLMTKIIGKPEIGQRLLSNLQVDISQTQSLLDWTPPIAFDEGIKKTVSWYLDI